MRFYLLGMTVVAFDQLTKVWIREAFDVGESRAVVPGYLYLTYVQNSGAAFGLFANQTGFFIATTIVVLAVTLVYRSHIARERAMLRLGYALGLSGAVGNFIDRIRFGWVTDFVDLRVWPVFNVADTAIVVGVAFLFWCILTEKEAKEAVADET